MRPSLRFQSPLNEILPDLFRVCLVFARRKLAFRCHGGNAIAYSVAIPGASEREARSGVDRSPFERGGMNRARGGFTPRESARRWVVIASTTTASAQ